MKSKLMESNTALFTLTIDSVTKTNLAETARWARFLAIVGFIFLGLTVLSGLLVSATFSRMGTTDNGTGLGSVAGIAGIGMAVTYIIFALIAFFRCCTHSVLPVKCGVPSAPTIRNFSTLPFKTSKFVFAI
jgi:hypothetical protein